MSFKDEDREIELNGNDLFEASQTRRHRRHFVMLETSEDMNEAWRELFKVSRCAGVIMHELLRNLGQHNAICVSRQTLHELTGYSVRSVSRAVDHLSQHNWIQVVQLNGKGDVNCYVVNDRVAWFGKRKNLAFSKFSATVLAKKSDQKKQQKGKLKKVPTLSTSVPRGRDKDDR